MAVIGTTGVSPSPVGTARPACLAWRAYGACGLLACALAQPAAADLLVEHQVIEAWTSLSEPGAPGNGPQGVVWQWGQPPGPVTVVSSQRGSTVAAAARQTPDGFFHTVATQARTWSELAGPRVALAQTLFQVTVSTNTPDTPLLLDFLFLGSRLDAGVHYGVGALSANTTLQISGGVGNGSAAAAPLVWGYNDQLQLDGRGNFQAPASTTTDVQGIGLPTAQASTGWFEFESRARIDRGAFSGTLGFGLLQPGQRFALQYWVESQITSDTPYPVHARAELVDPFGLREPPLQLSLRGLTLPTPVAVVPEPCSAALLLTGLVGGLVASGLRQGWLRSALQQRLRRAGWLRGWRQAGLPGGATGRLQRRRAVVGQRGAWLVVALGMAASLAAPLARADASASVGGVVGNSPGLAFIGFESDEVVGSGVARVSDSQQVQTAGGGVLNWIVGAFGDTRRGSAGAGIVADRGQTGPRGRIQAAAMVSDTLHFAGSRAGVVVISAGVFGSFEALSGSRFQADGTLTASTLGDSASADVRFAWTPSFGSPDPSVVATPGATGIGNLPTNLSATLHLPLLVQPGQDVVVNLNLSVSVDVAANDHAEVNFGHTAQLAIRLPEGLSYTSASGDFMVDAPPLPVPEPASGALLLAGLGGLALRARPGAAQRLLRGTPMRLMLPLVLAVMLAGAGGSAWADASAQVRSDSFESGLFERIDGGQLVAARAALSGGGALNTGSGQGSFLATAEADLRRGTLRGSAMVNTVGEGLTVAGSTSSLSDTLFFSNSEPITIALELAVHGAFNGLLRAYGDVNSQLRLGANVIRTELRWDTGPQELPSTPVRLLPVAGGTSPSRQVDLRSNLAANTLLVITASTEVMPGQPIVVDAAMSLSAWASSNAISQVSFGNTAQLSLQVPDGIGVRSASGLFLSQPPMPVPEPASAALLAAGLLLWAPRWRRRARAERPA